LLTSDAPKLARYRSKRVRILMHGIPKARDEHVINAPIKLLIDDSAIDETPENDEPVSPALRRIRSEAHRLTRFREGNLQHATTSENSRADVEFLLSTEAAKS